jgi:phage terminase small subunit
MVNKNPDTKELKKEGFQNGLLTDPSKLAEEARKAAMDLNDIQREFCHAMLTAENQTAAAITAGYSPKSARSWASQLMRMEKIQHYIGLLCLLRSQTIAVDSSEIMSMMLRNYYLAVENGKLKEANEAVKMLADVNGMFNRNQPKLPSAKEVAKIKSTAKDNNDIEEMTNLLTDVANRKQTSEG